MLNLAAGIARRGLGLFMVSLTVLFGAFTLLPLVAPVLAAAGQEQMAQAIFAGFSVACHQKPGHSFFLLGHQVAVCQRELGIYLGLFIASLVFHRFSARMEPMPIRLYALAVAPIIIDGVSQMVGVRESDWLLRVTTGGLFGAATIWAFFPRLALTLDEIDVQLSSELTTPGRSIA